MKNGKTLRRTVFIIFTFILLLVLCSLTVMADDSECENDLAFFEEFMKTPGYTDEQIREINLKAELERQALYEKKKIPDVDLKNADPKDTSVFKYSEEAAKIIDESKLTLIVPQQTFQFWSILGYIDFDKMVYGSVKLVADKKNWTVDDFYYNPCFYPDYFCLDKENRISRIVFNGKSIQYEVLWTTKKVQDFIDPFNDLVCNIFRDCVSLGMEHAKYYVLSSVNDVDVTNYYPTYELPDNSYPLYVFATNDEKTVALEYGRGNKEYLSNCWFVYRNYKLDRTLEFDEVKKLFESYYNYNLEKRRYCVDGDRFIYQYTYPEEWFNNEYYVVTEEKIKEYNEYMRRLNDPWPYYGSANEEGNVGGDVEKSVDNSVGEKLSVPVENEVKLEKAPVEAVAAAFNQEVNESNAGKTAFIISAITLFAVSLAISAVILVKKKNHS